MRIAQLAPLFESVPPKFYGGTERVVDNLTQGLLKRGHEVTVFCSGDSTVPGEHKVVWPEALRLARQPVVDSIAYQMRMLEMVAREASRFDVIHNHYDYPLLALGRMSPAPVVTTLHGRLDWPAADLRAVYERYPDMPLVSISYAQRRPLPNQRWIANVHHGQDVRQLEYRERPGQYLAFLGRFSRDKRPDWAIDIALKSGIPLKIAAKIDEYHPDYYERLIKPRIDGKFIEYVGEITESEKSDFLGNALALVFPIDWPEPFGLVMTEAMACGTPVLARPCGSVPEIVVDGVTGFVRESVDELAQLARVIATLDRAQVRRHIVENFSIERMTEEYLNVYRELTESEYESSNIRRLADHRRDIVHPVDGSSDGHTKGLA